MSYVRYEGMFNIYTCPTRHNEDGSCMYINDHASHTKGEENEEKVFSRYGEVRYKEVKDWLYTGGYNYAVDKIEEVMMNCLERKLPVIKYDSYSRSLMKDSIRYFIQDYEEEFPEKKVVKTLIVINFPTGGTILTTFAEGDWTKLNDVEFETVDYVGGNLINLLGSEFIDKFMKKVPLALSGTEAYVLDFSKFNSGLPELLKKAKINPDGLNACMYVSNEEDSSAESEDV